MYILKDGYKPEECFLSKIKTCVNQKKNSAFHVHDDPFLRRDGWLPVTDALRMVFYHHKSVCCDHLIIYKDEAHHMELFCRWATIWKKEEALKLLKWCCLISCFLSKKTPFVYVTYWHTNNFTKDKCIEHVTWRPKPPPKRRRRKRQLRSEGLRRTAVKGGLKRFRTRLLEKMDKLR